MRLQDVLPCLFFYSEYRQVGLRLGWAAMAWRILSVAAIFAYICVWQIFMCKGYQKYADDGQSVVFPEVRGSFHTNLSREDIPEVSDDMFSFYNRAWDAEDPHLFSVTPNGFFLGTNLVITHDQKRSACPDTPSKSTECDPNNADSCPRGMSLLVSTTIDMKQPAIVRDKTGRCVINDEFNQTTCEYFGWCPPVNEEPISLNTAVFNKTRHLVVQIQSTAIFPRYNVSINNNLVEKSRCLYNIDEHEATKYCRNFKVEDIVKLTDRSFDDIAIEGAVIIATVEWSCDLGVWELHGYIWNQETDRQEWIDENCLPTVTFTFLKGGHRNGGWYKIDSYYDHVDKQDRRDMYKTFGLDFQTQVIFKVGKFDLMETLSLLIAGLALIATSELIFFLVFSGFCGLCLPSCCCDTARDLNNTAEEGFCTKSWVEAEDHSTSLRRLKDV